jgi:hypothetical protein
VRGTIDRVFARDDVLNACRKQDLGTVIEILMHHGVTQGWIAGRTSLGQGRLSEYMNHKRKPQATSTFEKFANGIGMPPATRRALGLDRDQSPSTDVDTQPLDRTSRGVGLAYPDTPAEAAENLARLWRADLASSPLQPAGLDPTASSDASLHWLIDPPRSSESESGSGARIGAADVERFRATVELFTHLDDRFGGSARCIRYLRDFRKHLVEADNGRSLAASHEEAAAFRLWHIASRSG